MADMKIINLDTYDEHDLVRWLRAIVNTFQKYKQARGAFIVKFPAFEEMRVPNVRYMNKIADILDEHKRKCNIATIVGTTVGILGGAAIIGGAVTLTFFTAGAAAPLVPIAVSTAGGATAALGGITSFGTYITGRIIEKGKQNNINDLLKKDKEYFEKVFTWVQHSAKLEQAVEDVMNFSVFQGLIDAFNKDPVIIEGMERSTRMCELPITVKHFIDDLNIGEDQKRQLKILLLEILRSTEGFPLFRKIILFFRNMAPFIYKAYSVIEGAIRFFRVADATVDVGNTIANIVKSTTPAARLAAVFGAVAAIGVAIDIWVLVSTSKDMTKGSKSELARRIRHCAQELQNELNALKHIYIALTS